MKMTRSLAGVFMGAVLAATSVRAQIPFTTVYKEVGIDQNLNARLPLDLTFRDEDGNAVRLDEFFASKPVILSLVYYQCPMLCTQVLNGMVDGFKGLPLTAGREFTVVTVSIDPRETPEMAREKKGAYLQAYGRAGAERGWHFLTGDEASIRRLADAVGFHYLYDAKTGQFAHAAGIMVATTDGHLSRYLYGIEYSPTDLQFALMDASRGKIGSVVNRLILLCYHYDPTTGKYNLVIADIFRGAGAVTIVLLGGAVFILLRRERRKTAVQQAS